MGTRTITFTVPTSTDLEQENLKALIQFEINKARVEMSNQVTAAYNEIYDHVATPTTGTMDVTLNSAETTINNNINSTFATVSGGTVTAEGTFVTEMKNYVDDKLSTFEKHVTESLATKANITTAEALDEFFQVVNSAIQISGEGGSYTAQNF